MIYEVRWRHRENENAGDFFGNKKEARRRATEIKRWSKEEMVEGGCMETQFFFISEHPTPKNKREIVALLNRRNP